MSRRNIIKTLAFILSSPKIYAKQLIPHDEIHYVKGEIRFYNSENTHLEHDDLSIANLERAINNAFLGWDFKTGMHNFQCHAFDTINRHIYTLQHSTNNDNGAKITRFNMDKLGSNLHDIDTQGFDIRIGHQMLSIEHNSSVKLWTAKGPQESLSVIRFDYCPNGNAKNVEEYFLFNPEIFGSFYLTGNLSSDQKWIIVRGKSKDSSDYKGKNCIAIFERDKVLKHGPGNVWHLVEHIWPYDYYQRNSKNTSINPQSIFSEGKYVYLIFGPLDINKPNLIRKYSLQGELIDESSELTLGKREALQISNGLANELEGAQLVDFLPNSRPFLTIGFVRGGPVYYKGVYIIKI